MNTQACFSIALLTVALFGCSSETINSITGGSTSGGTTTHAPFTGTFDVSGAWAGQWSIGPTTGDIDLTATQTGAKITGTISITQSGCWTTGPIDGSGEGTTMVFGVVNDAGTTDFSGEVAGDQASGTFHDSCGSSGQWTIKRK